MKNVKMTRNNSRLLIDIDLSVPGEESKSGKSVIIASTEGNKDVPDTNGIKIGLNIYRPKN